MRFSTFFKVSGAVAIVAVLALGGVYSGIQAGPLAQATSDASMAATMAAGSAATTSAMTFAPCPPATMSASEVATMSASEVATMEASMPATATSAATVSVANPGYIGVRVQLVDSCGLMVVEVLPESPALTAGVQVGDVIVAAGGVAITSLDDMRNVTNQYSAGDKLTLTVQRNGAQLDIVVTLGLRPSVIPATLEATTSASTGASSSGASSTMAATMAATK